MVPVTENIAASLNFSNLFHVIFITCLSLDSFDGWIYKFKNATIVSWIINVVYLATV